MKRYMLFVFAKFYPNGGMKDFKGDFNTLGEAQFMEIELTDEWSISQIYDSIEGEFV